MSEIKQPFWLPKVGARESALVAEVLASNFLNDGKVTAEFEQKIAALLGCKYAVTVTSGTTALTLALIAMGIGHGDEVIVPDVTFIATANAVTLAGATPILVDAEPATLNIDPASIRKAITPKTKAIMPVHISGRAADMKAIFAIAKQHGLRVVEDAAEAFMSKCDGRFLGTLAEAGCFSFSPNKTITTGQGGAIVTNDERLYTRLRELKDQGRPVRGTGGADTHISVGFNFKFTNLQAAVGLGQLSDLPNRVERMRAIHRGYLEGLAGVKGVRLFESKLNQGELLQWVDAIVDRRDELDEYLLARGMQCRRFWFPIHTQAAYRHADVKFPHASQLIPRSIWFPSAFTLSDADVSSVCREIRKFYER